MHTGHRVRETGGQEPGVLGNQLGHLPVRPPLQAGGVTQAVFQADLAAECKGRERFESRRL